jgi:hypothetical protein
VAYVRTVKTASGKTAVQIVWSSTKGSRRIEHLGSAATDAEVELLKAAGRQKLLTGQGELDLGIQPPSAAGGPLHITSSRMGHLWDSLARAYDELGFDVAVGDEVFRQLVLARIIEPTSKADAPRVIAEAGVAAASDRTITRRLRLYSAIGFREQLAAACAAQVNLGPATLVLYDVTTLYFETDEGDGFREPGFSKERRLEPQITVGLLSDANGFPLMVHAFEGNKAETKTMLPTLRAFMDTHGLHDVVIVADAGMVSEANMEAIEAAGLSYILGAKMPRVPYVIEQWRTDHPGADVPDGLTLVARWPGGPSTKGRDVTSFYAYAHDRGRRTIKGIEAQVAKAEAAVAGKASVKRNRFVQLSGGTRSVNRALEEKARSLAGWKAYVTNLPDPDAEMVIGSYRRLFQIERSFRMAKSDLRARPIYHRKQDSIEAHLSIVFAAMAVAHWIEQTTGWSIKRFVKTARRYRTFTIAAGEHTITAVDPVPDDLAQALDAIKDRSQAH